MNEIREATERLRSRRAAHIKGELQTRMKFNELHGRIEQAREAEQQLALFATDIEEEAETESPEFVGYHT